MLHIRTALKQVVRSWHHSRASREFARAADSWQSRVIRRFKRKNGPPYIWAARFGASGLREPFAC
jgi:hypothetical protein